MNRIILIGNGFDLAHGLKTSYRDFIDDYWKTFIEEARKNGSSYEDDYVSFKTNTKTLAHIISGDTNNLKLLEKDIEHFKSGIWGGNGTTIELSFKNSFLEQISKHVSDKSWVDIENEYYEFLKKSNHGQIEILNEEFKAIEQLLEKHLLKIQNGSEIVTSIFSPIRSKIYSLIFSRDLSKEDSFIYEIESDLEELDDSNIRELDGILEDCKNIYNEMKTSSIDVKQFISNYQKEADLDSESGIDYIEEKISNNTIPDYFMLPKEILFLNFNYTHTQEKYISDKQFIQTIHIHGELNNPKNPIIFGYGDELAEDYKQIENLNDNEYLKNVKSIRYLETDNYRKMLSFIESEPYQIFIMGHSCGNSDRTLLNTLFEHKNCVSIKPFFHQREDGSNNYNEIVQNISRNFTNKAAMRERVVNKTYCERLT
ncbi:AbiH family protein [Dysgonomonas gadei]|uniref:Bacteriophage abortive infection AbiH n=1 Tax=Dysgonomonas gadei ATCC BAA-286 TaxID=742766 RepID=F5IT08_9BACT|nr:AbiH family protein [Dysgonomonas gadei]EGK01185.1 hypothetical protein HMPREF9455_00225 [Dysgonomonas gadei ATCC BAA-286]